MHPVLILLGAAGIYLAIGAVAGLAAVAAHQGWIRWLRITNREDFDRADRACGSETVAWWLFAYVMLKWPWLLPGHRL
jgi:hypothetical protein